MLFGGENCTHFGSDRSIDRSNGSHWVRARNSMAVLAAVTLRWRTACAAAINDDRLFVSGGHCELHHLDKLKGKCQHGRDEGGGGDGGRVNGMVLVGMNDPSMCDRKFSKFIALFFFQFQHFHVNFASRILAQSD